MKKKDVCTKTLQELAPLLGVTIKGDPQCRVSRLASLDQAGPGDLSFLTNPQYRKYLATTQASAVILSAEEAEGCPVPVLISDNPRFCLVKAAKLFEQDFRPKPGIHPTAVIDESVHIPETASIGAFCNIEKDVTLGENVVIESHSVIGQASSIGSNSWLKPRVTLYPNVKIGENCLVHSGTVIGSDGFGYAQHNGQWAKMPHLGGVSIGNQVEIGANTTIDRGFLEDTSLGNGVIVDNLVQIGHNVVIGDRTAIAACVGIAGSARIGKDCMIGGGSCIAGHLEITDKVYITATSGVNHSLRNPGTYSSGLPAKLNHIWRKNVARFQYLDEMARRLRALENHLGLNARVEVE